MASKVFISHAEEDSELAIRIYLILERMGLNPWEYKLHPEYGRGLDEIIRDKIRQCEVFVPLLTSNGIYSQWVNQEIGVAYALNRYIIPVVQTGEPSRGFVEFKQHIAYYPANIQQTIYDLIYILRLLTNPSGILCKCKGCGRESSYSLPEQKLINECIENGVDLEVACENCEAKITISRWTLEVI